MMNTRITVGAPDGSETVRTYDTDFALFPLRPTMSLQR